MSDNEDNNKPAKRATKKDRFEEERLNILNRMYEIIGITNATKYLYFEDLENDENKKNRLTELAIDVKKYFKCGRWVYYAKNDRPHIHTSLIKSILKDTKIKTERIRLVMEKSKNKIGIKIE